MTLINNELETIIEQFEPMINSIANKYARPPRVNREDLEQEGRMAVWSGLSSFEEGKGAKLTTYIYTCIKNAMSNYFQKNAYELHSTAYFQDDEEELELIKDQERKLVSLDKKIDEDLSLADCIKGNTNVTKDIERDEEDAYIQGNIKTLSDEEQFIIMNSQLFFGKMSLEELGNKLGKSTRQCVHQKLKRALEKLRIKMEERYETAS